MARSVTEGRLSRAAAARQFNVTAKTVTKWVARFRTEGVDGLRDRSSRPLSLPSQTAAATCARVEVLRRQRYTGKQIAIETGVSEATVSRILRRLGLNRPVGHRITGRYPGAVIDVAIVPSKDGWTVVTNARGRNKNPRCARRIEQLQKQLRDVYVLAKD